MSEIAKDRLPFDETEFVAEPGAQGEFTEEVRAEIANIRAHYPELAAWGDLAIFEAWRDYSQNVYLLSWLEFVDEEEEFRAEFLDFLCWNQTRGQFPWGAPREQLKSMRPIWCRQAH